MIDIINNYNMALQKIYDHVGFVEDWVIYPISDDTDYFWKIIDDNQVKFAKTIEQFNSGKGDCYINSIYTQRFYSKWIYEGNDFTMIFCNTHTDGMIYFSLFDNKKRIE